MTTTTTPRGYLLPEDPNADGFECAVVFYPNKPEYRQALRGALDYFATWLAWERESEKKGRIAAHLWKQANELTCFNEDAMTCFQQIINNITYNNQTNVSDCWCEYVTINPPEVTYEDVIPYVGPPPTTWGDIPVATWDDWTALACAAAHKYVDYIKAQANDLAELVTTVLLSVGLVAGILALLSGFGLAVLAGVAIAFSIFQALVTNPTEYGLDEVEDEIEDGREAIVEAIVCGGDLAAVMEGVINSLAWGVLYQFVNWQKAATIVRSGKSGDENLPPVEPHPTPCPCDGLYHLFLDFQVDPTPLVGYQDDCSYHFGHGHIHAQIADTGGTPRFSISGDNLRTYFGLAGGTNLYLQSLSYTIGNEATVTCTSNNHNLLLSNVLVDNRNLSGALDTDLVELSYAPGSRPLCTGLNWGMPNCTGGGAGQFTYVDNISAVFRLTP